MTTKKKVIIGIVIAGVVLTIGKLATSGKASSNIGTGPMVSTGTVTKEDITQTLKLTSLLEGKDSIEVASGLHYEVTEVFVKEGDRVTQGQTLATLDTTSLKRELESGSGNVRLLELQNDERLKERQESLDNAYDEYNKAVLEYDKQKQLFDGGVISESELKKYSDTIDACQTKIDSIPADNRVAILSDSEKQAVTNARLESSIRSETLKECTITSPISGTVTRVNTKVGRFADNKDTNQPMFVIENVDELKMKVLVSENDIRLVEVGQKVNISANILGNEIVEGVVERISPTGEEKSSGTGGRVVPVYVSVTGKNEKLIAGINAKATIIIAEEKDALTVPIECIYENEKGEEVIYTLSPENTVHIIPVTLGAESDLYVSVKGEGLNEGTTVILNPSEELTEGGSVIVNQMEALENEGNN